MERIKQALERAREEREKAVAGDRREAAHPQASPAPAEPPPVEPAVEARAAPPARNPVPAPEDGAISYTRTRVVSPRAQEMERRRVLSPATDDAVVAGYQVLRTKVIQKMRARGWNALAVTSPGAGEGKTLTAVNLAISIAREVRHTVLLADLDLRRPSVHRCFAHEPEYGIEDCLRDGRDLGEVLFNPGIERLVVLPGAQPVENSSELLSSPAMARLVDELKTRYPSRFVIFDLPPVLSFDDTLAFSPYADAVLLVIQDGATHRDEVTRSMQMLENTELLGTVLNRSDELISTYY